MNPTTNSQALLTKTFLHFTPFFFFFLFSPQSLVFVQQQLHATFPYSLLLCPTNVQLPVNNLYSLYLSFYFFYEFYLYNARQQVSKSHKQSQSQKPKTKKKHKQFRIFRSQIHHKVLKFEGKDKS